ncbi:MAG: hypothetical protein EAZ77_00825 [Nostocales cyanobacterium]|nr:MAG: hypothetical protein EAZ77_00825 [Nostocales cyanobacterium]
MIDDIYSLVSYYRHDDLDWEKEADDTIILWIRAPDTSIAVQEIYELCNRLQLQPGEQKNTWVLVPGSRHYWDLRLFVDADI